jgi:hypothetical protein
VARQRRPPHAWPRALVNSDPSWTRYRWRAEAAAAAAAVAVHGGRRREGGPEGGGILRVRISRGSESVIGLWLMMDCDCVRRGGKGGRCIPREYCMFGVGISVSDSSSGGGVF